MNCCLLGSSPKYAPLDTIQQTTKYCEQKYQYEYEYEDGETNGVPAGIASGYPGITHRALLEEIHPHQNNAHINTNKQQVKSLVRTGGNALMEYNPETMSDLVRVTVPRGVWPGQIVQVLPPESNTGVHVHVHPADVNTSQRHTYRYVMVPIPFGCLAGSSFLVRLPKVTDGYENGYENGYGNCEDLKLNMENHNPGGEETKSNHYTNGIVHQSGSPQPQPQPQPSSQPQLLPQSRPQSAGNANYVILQSEYLHIFQFPSDNEKREKLLVHTPPGVMPGTLIHVQIPGREDRFLPVMVPEGVSFSSSGSISGSDTGISQFYVEYNLEDTIEKKMETNANGDANQSSGSNNNNDSAPTVVLPMLV